MMNLVSRIAHGLWSCDGDIHFQTELVSLLYTV